MKRKHQTTIKHLMQALGSDDSLDLWNILSMLRGNDSENNALKKYTVARIRALIGMPGDMGLTVNPDPLTEDERVERDELLRLGSFHFTHHYDAACNAIQEIYGYDPRHETWVCVRCDSWMPALGTCNRDLIERLPPARAHVCGTCQAYDARLRRQRRGT